ncbi:MAG: cyclic pyranopterin monophosphate synthase MoaC [Acidobacteriota bacterium]
MTHKLSHVGGRGEAHMVDVSHKSPTVRKAVAAGRVVLSEEAFQAVRANRLAKGDILAVARLAGIMAAKRTSEWVPLAHQVNLDQVEVDLSMDEATWSIEIRASSRARCVTGVEMEALVAVSAAGLALYDMVKAADRGAIIGPFGVISKSGGRTGEYSRLWPPSRGLTGSTCKE